MKQAEYQARIDAIAASGDAREILKAIYILAELYFDLLRQYGIHTSEITIVDRKLANSKGPVIEKYITADSLRQGGNFATKH
jgi:hypothetical protein